MLDDDGSVMDDLGISVSILLFARCVCVCVYFLYFLYLSVIVSIDRNVVYFPFGSRLDSRSRIDSWFMCLVHR